MSPSNPLDRTVEVPAGFTIKFLQEPHDYIIIPEKVPSVTEITKMIGGPGGLPWWGMVKGVEGTLAVLEIADETRDVPSEEIVQRLIDQKLTVNHQRDQAGARGTDVHVAASRWAEHGEEVDPLAYPEEQMGYVSALQAWLKETSPRVIAAEQIVGSKILGYAGTLDLRCIIDGRVGIVDYKTSGSIRHPQYDYQLAGYELASQECGYGETDFRAILRLDKDGTFEWYESPLRPAAFQQAVGIWYEDRSIKEFLKAQKKAARKVKA